jgi:uncharacterized protein YidB (DUF937 family)
MDPFDDIAGAVAGRLALELEDAVAGARGDRGDLAQAVIAWLGSGGLAQLTTRFQQAGLGHVMSSWVGTGENLPVSPDQIVGAVGTGQLGVLARQVGLDPRAVAGQLATILPVIIDRLTPAGAVPGGDALGDALARLRKLF